LKKKKKNFFLVFVVLVLDFTHHFGASGPLGGGGDFLSGAPFCSKPQMPFWRFGWGKKKQKFLVRNVFFRQVWAFFFSQKGARREDGGGFFFAIDGFFFFFLKGV